MTRITGPDCVVISNFINIHTYIHTHRGEAQGTQGLSKSCSSRESVSPLSKDQCEWHIVTKMTGLDCAVM